MGFEFPDFVIYEESMDFGSVASNFMDFEFMAFEAIDTGENGHLKLCISKVENRINAKIFGYDSFIRA